MADTSLAAEHAVIVVDHDGRIASWSGEAERCFLRSSAEVLGQRLTETLMTGSAASAYDVVLAALRSGEVSFDVTEIAVARPGDSALRVELTAWRADAAAGSCVVLARSAQTSSAQEQAESASNERYRLLVESSLDYGIFLLDSDGTIATWNVGAERLKGYTAQEAIGQHFSIFYTDEQRASGHPAYELSVAADTGRYEEEYWRVRKDGSQFWANVIITALYEDGVLSGFSKVTRDMTERRALESELERARDGALDAARSRQEFLSTMSHEIRTPMNAVIGMTSLLLDTNLDADQREYAEIVGASGEHLLALINDILDYSKIDAGKLVLEATPFVVRSWVHDSVDLVALTAHDKGLELICDVAPAVPSVVVGDPGRLRQVLLNLLSNAVKFTATGEVVVRVDCEAEAGPDALIRVAVHDTGVGIEESRIEPLFDAFTQADSSTTRVYGGTGLGLAISRKLVERMGGSLTLISAPGEGTTAEFSFLAARSDVAPTRALPDLSGKRALIVDDNATNRLLLETWFTRHAIANVSVASGAEALAVVRDDHAFDFGVLDLMMPSMDGADLGVILRSEMPDIKLVLLSSAGKYARDIAASGTFDAHAAKPVRPETLLELMARLLVPGYSEEIAPKALSAFDLPGVAHTLSILVVEDNPVNQRVAQHLLRRFGFDSDVAAGGHKAIAALEQHPYDLVLMDMQMPDMDGLAATREIRRRWPQRPIRIVAMTANVAQEDVQHCREAGMDAFLGKPISAEALGAELAIAAEQVPPA